VKASVISSGRVAFATSIDWMMSAGAMKPDAHESQASRRIAARVVSASFGYHRRFHQTRTGARQSEQYACERGIASLRRIRAQADL
jgi:hypothetical protein